jgi:hypothetical protein
MQVKGIYYGGETTNPGKPYTESSLKFIKKFGKSMKAQSVANILHRPVRSVRKQAVKLGVKFL